MNYRVDDDDDWYKFHYHHRLYSYLHWVLVVVERRVNDDGEERPKDDLVEERQMEVWVNDDEAKNV
jgi:hypothetical protein